MNYRHSNQSDEARLRQLDQSVQRSVHNLLTRNPSQPPPSRRDVFESDRGSLRTPAFLAALGSPSEAMDRRWDPVSTSPSIVLPSRLLLSHRPSSRTTIRLAIQADRHKPASCE